MDEPRKNNGKHLTLAFLPFYWSRTSSHPAHPVCCCFMMMLTMMMWTTDPCAPSSSIWFFGLLRGGHSKRRVTVATPYPKAAGSWPTPLYGRGRMKLTPKLIWQRCFKIAPSGQQNTPRHEQPVYAKSFNLNNPINDTEWYGLLKIILDAVNNYVQIRKWLEKSCTLVIQGFPSHFPMCT